MNDEAAQFQTSQTVGERIRAARENRKLSQEELASHLHLQLNIIQALETNAFDQLAAPTYTKGYLRSVARQLDLDGDELIELYEGGNSVSSGPEILPQVSKHAQFSSTDKPVKIVTYLISLGLVILLLIWWQSEFIVDTTGELSDINAQSAGGPFPGGFNYTYDIIIHPDGPFYRAPSVSDTGEPDDGPVNEMPDVEDTPPILNIDESVGAQSPQPPPTSDETVNSSQATSSLLLNISKESWVEIHDANDNKLYLDIAQPGEVIRINGKQPLSLVLGNADGVEVIWEGSAFDTAPYSHAGVARFKLGESQDL